MPLQNLQKPQYRLHREQKRATRVNGEKAAKRAAKARDGHRCRWPRFDHETPFRKCVGRLESAHEDAKGMGGDPKNLRSGTKHLFTACMEIHQGMGGLEKHGRKWEELEPGKGADGPVRFLKQVLPGEWMELARERSIGILEKP